MKKRNSLKREKREKREKKFDKVHQKGCTKKDSQIKPIKTVFKTKFK